MRLRPSARVAALGASLAVLLALGALYRPLVFAALVLDGLLVLAWIADVAAGGRLGWLAPDPAAAELVFAVDGARLGREAVALARTAARRLGAWLVAIGDLAEIAPGRLVVFTDVAGASSAPAEAIVIVLRASSEIEPLVARLERELRVPA